MAIRKHSSKSSEDSILKQIEKHAPLRRAPELVGDVSERNSENLKRVMKSLGMNSGFWEAMSNPLQALKIQLAQSLAQSLSSLILSLPGKFVYYRQYNLEVNTAEIKLIKDKYLKGRSMGFIRNTTKIYTVCFVFLKPSGLFVKEKGSKVTRSGTSVSFIHLGGPGNYFPFLEELLKIERTKTGQSEKRVEGVYKSKTNSADFITNVKPLSSIFGPAKTILLEDVKSFDRSASRYSRMGLKFKRVYLLWGEPGGGKTSLVLSLAAELGKSLEILDPDIFEKNSDSTVLIQASSEFIGGKPQNNDDLSNDRIILIEDIDRASERLNLSKVLNYLDGAIDPGSFIFLTANHPEVLDEALTRRGRVDRKIYVGPLSPLDCGRLFESLFEVTDWKERVAQVLGDRSVIPAEIEGICLDNWESPEAAFAEIEKTYAHVS